MAGERGTISIVVVTGVLVLCLTALAAADLGSMVLARARAQSAADAAALAAVVAQVEILGRPGDPQDEAEAVAAANGATVLRCTCDPGTPWAHVEVDVRPTLAFMSVWLGRSARAEARAEVDPDVLSYRDGG